MTEEKGKMKIRPFEYDGVTLLDSRFKQQFDEMVEYFLEIPEDDMLVGFRRRAGLPHPGNELGGWYSGETGYAIYHSNGLIVDSDERFTAFGQWLSAFGRIYRITRDERILAKAQNLLTEWGKTVAEDGYPLYSYECNALHYAYEKLFGGLVDLYMYAGLTEAKKYMDRITSWAEKNLERTKLPAGASEETFTGGNPATKLTDNEWYTLSENLYRAYLATGDERYKRFAKVWHYDYYWDALRNGEADKMSGVHGYSHVNNIGGAAMAYRVTGDEKYLATIVNGYELLKENQLMASGGYAPYEHMATPDGSNYTSLEEGVEAFEVPCGSWAGFKLTRHLISHTGAAKYGEWAETLLYNAIGAALPMRDDSQRRGKTFYYADYRIGGGRKVYYGLSYPCCSGTYPQAVAEYANMIYYSDEEGIYVTQYIPSILKTRIQEMDVEITISGKYPETERFQIAVAAEGRFRLSLRAPSWLSSGEGQVTINGEETVEHIVAGEWITVEREWHTGDVLEVVFPMHLWTSGITALHPERAALMYGPIMLAAEGRHRKTVERYDDLSEMEATGSNLTFRSKDGLFFRPFYSFGYREWYTCYLDYEK